MKDEKLRNLNNLTQQEVEALGFVYNLADAHTHQGQSLTQQRIIDNLPAIFRDAEKTKQADLEKSAYENYHKLANQHAALKSGKTLICYSASMAMEVVANYLRLHNYAVTLIEPTFDNIPDILKRHGISLVPFSDHDLQSETLESKLASITTQVLFLTLPNNPTGRYLTKIDFQILVEQCAKMNILLIVDACFRLYEPESLYDQYEILRASKIRYIFLEDTGKIWATLDLKIGFINSCDDIFNDLANIHSDFLLNVSPFILRLLLSYFDDAMADNFNSIRNLISTNRDFLVTHINKDILAPTTVSRVSVEFLQINNGIEALSMQSFLKSKGVFVLSGTEFYWHNPQIGNSFIRIALARNSDIFRDATIKMVSALSQI